MTGEEQRRDESVAVEGDETLEGISEIARLGDVFGIDPDEETARFEIQRL